MTTFRPARNVPRVWLPLDGIKDRATGWEAIEERADGKLYACLSTGLWYEITRQDVARQMIGN